jgi:hypothetical protein
VGIYVALQENRFDAKVEVANNVGNCATGQVDGGTVQAKKPLGKVLLRWIWIQIEE